MDFLNTILAQLFEKFRLNNPKVAAVVLLALFLLLEAARQGVLLGIFPDAPWLSQAVAWVSGFLLLVTSTKTTQYLPGQLRAQKEALYVEQLGLPKPVVQDNRDKTDDVLMKWLARAFEYFKAKSPTAAALVLFTLALAMEAANRGVALQLFHLPAWADEVLFTLSAIFAALSSGRVVAFLPFSARKVREMEYERAIAA